MPSRRNALYFLATLSLLAGLFTGRADLFIIAYLIAAVMILSFIWTWLSLRGIALRRSTRTRRSQVGRVFQESFGVRKTGITPKLWLEIRDHSTLPGHQASRVVPTLLGNREYTWDAETVCAVRGEFQLGPMTVVSGDPFGLFHSPRRIGATDRLIVYPMTVELNRVILPIGFLSGGDAQRQLTHEITTNASSIRDYVSGDSMNRIHWRSTARTGNIMVKEFELDPLVDIWLFNDFSVSSLFEEPSIRRNDQIGIAVPSSARIPPSTEEYGVIVAASLAKHFLDDERVIGYAAYTPYRQVFQPERGSRQLTRILEALAGARSASDHTLKDMLSLETHLFTRGDSLMIITSSLDQDWISEAQVLQRRGIRLNCVYVDPQSFSVNLDSSATKGLLQLAKIPTIVISKDDDMAAALEQRPS
ncbi:MAG: DUF58 domain-containing protein [Chloroflexota bacterium]|nr:DUF58 domain-containing protein [Chloroflexota bacterium]MDE2946333.1 DUF58 domain-containing protein [Chloroflexota bacterium]